MQTINQPDESTKNCDQNSIPNEAFHTQKSEEDDVFTSHRCCKKEVTIKPSPPKSLTKPLNLWSDSSGDLEKLLTSVSSDFSMSISLPHLNKNDSFSTTTTPISETSRKCSKVSQDSRHLSESSLSSNKEVLPDSTTTGDFSALMNQFSPMVEQSESNTLNTFLHQPRLQTLLDEKSSFKMSNNSVNDYGDTLSDDIVAPDHEEGLFSRGIERSTTYPTTITELIHAETRASDSWCPKNFFLKYFLSVTSLTTMSNWLIIDKEFEINNFWWYVSLLELADPFLWSWKQP